MSRSWCDCPGCGITRALVRVQPSTLDCHCHGCTVARATAWGGYRRTGLQYRPSLLVSLWAATPFILQLVICAVWDFLAAAFLDHLGLWVYAGVVGGTGALLLTFAFVGPKGLAR
jgi:hypothetical protein